MDLKKIGQYIQKKRKELGLTQAELAEKLGMSNKSVSKWERGVCLPDVSVYMELCEILGISLNEFIAGEDIKAEEIVQKSEENIVEVTKDGMRKRAKLKTIIITLCVIVTLIVAAMGYYFYPIIFPKTNYLEPMDSESKEVELAKTWFGVGKAFLYNYSIDDSFENADIYITLYRGGEQEYRISVASFPILGETRDGFLAIFHDYLDDEVKIQIGGDGVVGGSIEGPVFKEIEEMIMATSQSRETIRDISHGGEIGLAVFYFDDESVLGCSVESIEKGELGDLPKQNDYAYYLSVVFS